MKVRSLRLRHFRNIREASFEPDPRLNFLVGTNGAGKTSFLEALGFLATLRSFRGSKSQEVQSWGADFAEVQCELEPDTLNPIEAAAWRTELKVAFQGPAKVAFINGKPYKSSTSYLSQRFGQFELGFHSVIFNPSDHDLVRGEPAIRRSYLDRMLAALDVNYLKTVHRYQKLLQQRNAVLKQEPPDRPMLLGFTETLAKYAAELVLARLGWIKNLSEGLNNTARRIAPSQPDLRLVYRSNWVPEIDSLSFLNNDLSEVHFSGQGPLPSLELLVQAFWKRFTELERAEWKSGHSLVGPHRDDWAFYLGSQPLEGHGSQGEVRSALLALKLSEIDLFRNATGHRPLFLLDDFSSELDVHRRSFLLRFLEETDLQVFVTTTEDRLFAGKRFIVSGGNISPDPASKE